MARLKDRNKFIPNGFRFYQPETKFEPPRHVSFDATVNAIIAHRKGNPSLIQKHNWNVAFDGVADELDAYNTKICQQQGWHEFLTEGGVAEPATPFQRSLPSRLKSVAAGGSVLVEWLRDGAEAVPKELATKRAAVCAECPKNGKGDFTRWFTVPVSEAIHAEIERKNQMRLSTPFDDRIEVCEACLCPLKLKVHMPINRIRDNLPAESHRDLDPSCWIPREI